MKSKTIPFCLKSSIF